MDEEQLFGSGDSSSDAGDTTPVNTHGVEESSEDEASVKQDDDSSVQSGDPSWGSASEEEGQGEATYQQNADEDEHPGLEDEEEREEEDQPATPTQDSDVEDEVQEEAEDSEQEEGVDLQEQEEEERPETPVPDAADSDDSDAEYPSGGEQAVEHDSDSHHEAESHDSDQDNLEDVNQEASQEQDSDQDDAVAATFAESDKSDEEQENQDRHSDSGENESDDSEIGRKKVQSQLGLTSSSDDDEEKGTEKVDNLFGDADDISSSDDDAEEKSEKEIRPLVTDDEEGGDAEEQGEEEPKEAMETRIEVEIPKITTDLGSAIHFVRFPNFISAEPRPFDAAVYEDEIEEDELLDEEGRTRLKLKVENTIRWRKYIDENNIELTESNSRIVRWSDGSISLHLGSEIFDVHQMSLQGDHNHLFIRQGTGLQGQAVFKTKLTFRPHSTKSATHKKMTNRLAMRHNQNQQKVRVLPIAGQDPESRKAALMKEEEDQLKAHMRREAQKRRQRERSHARGLTSNYLDNRYDEGTTNDDDDEGISVSAIKNRFKSGPQDVSGGMRRERIYSSDSDSDAEKRLMNAKRLSSDEDDIGGKRRREEDGEARKKTYNIVSDDDEEEDTMMSS